MPNRSLFGVNGNGANGPAASVAYSGPFTAGTVFKVTSTGQFLLGYYLWRADSSQGAAANFGLWQVTGAAAGSFIAGSAAAISGMTIGAWNFRSVSPVALTSGTSYKAVYGAPNNFPDTQHSFGGTTDPYRNGIINGVLTGFSDLASNGGTLPEPGGTFQGTFSTASSDPTANYPTTADISSNFWIDVLVGVPASGGLLMASLP